VTRPDTGRVIGAPSVMAATFVFLGIVLVPLMVVLVLR